MLKIKSILVSLLAVAALASCSKENDENDSTTQGSNMDVAYMSLRISLPSQKANTRASGELDPEGAEGDIKTLHVITFNDSKKLVHHSKQSPVIVLQGTSLTGSGNSRGTNAIMVSADTKFLLVVANPGTKLAARLGSMTSGSSYDEFNDMVQTVLAGSNDKPETLVGEIVDNTKGFTMINAGFYNDVSDVWEQGCLLDVSGNVVVYDGTNYADEDAAKAAAEASGKRATLDIERLSAKVEVSVKDPSELTVLPEGATFEFLNWTLDYYNSLFFPFAEKSTTKATHTSAFYKNNFYTTDPNFADPDHRNGITLNKVVDRAPNVTWKNKSVRPATPVVEYCIENTMADGDQKFGAATRIVIKGKYAPKDYTLGEDWFSYAGITYKDLDEIQTAYSDAKKVLDDRVTEIGGDPTDAMDQAKLEFPVEAKFVEVCDNFLGAVNAALAPTAIATFADIKQDTHLDAIANGGEIVKIADCIKWYPKSINYYYYEIRHDNTNDEYMYFGKYGVVRNNWYSLSLGKVNGAGTPWYPGGGPEDPDPETPIDEKPGFLAFDIKVAPWVYWQTDFEI